MRVYVRSLLFLFLVAIKELRQEVKIEARNSLGALYFAKSLTISYSATTI